MRFIPILILTCLVLLCVPAMADQAVPFAPLGNVTGNYTLYQGNDFWQISTNVPISSQDVVYSETIWDIIILIGVAFLFLAVVFVSLSDSVPWIAMLMCGFVTFGTELVAAEMTPLVGYTHVFQQIIPTTGASGQIVLNTTNSVYINEVIVYTQGQFAAYACWGLAMAGIIVAIAAVCFNYGWLHARGLKEADNGNYVEPDAGAGMPEMNGYKKVGK